MFSIPQLNQLLLMEVLHVKTELAGKQMETIIFSRTRVN